MPVLLDLVTPIFSGIVLGALLGSGRRFEPAMLTRLRPCCLLLLRGLGLVFGFWLLVGLDPLKLALCALGCALACAELRRLDRTAGSGRLLTLQGR